MTVIVLGLDGASRQNLSSVAERANLPALKKLLTEGAADLRSVYPYVTAPAWTSIFSGVNPGKHGIFEMFDVKAGAFNPANMAKCNVPFIWDYVSWANKSALVMGPPFFHPAPVVRGYFVTGRFVPRLSCYPTSLPDRFDLSGYQYEDIHFEDEIENVMEEGSRTVGRRLIEDFRRRIDVSLEILDSKNWDFALFVDSLPDDLFHICYDDKVTVDELFVELDRWVAAILSRLKPSDSLLVVSDHGFSGIDGVIFMNEWLQSKGYLSHHNSLLSRVLANLGLDWNALSRPGSVSSLYRFLLKRFPRALELAKKRLRRDMVLDRGNAIDAEVSAFNINEPVAWLRLSQKDDSGPKNLELRVTSELEQLKTQGFLREILATNEVYQGPRIGDAPGQLLVEARDGWVIDSVRWNNGKLLGKPLLTKRGAHTRNGIFISYPSGSRAIRDLLNVYDVTPTVLNLLKLPIPRTIDGTPAFQGSEEWRLDVPQSL